MGWGFLELGKESAIPVRSWEYSFSRLSYMGLPCPNVFSGGHNYHGIYEFIPIPSMIKAVEVVVNIAKLVHDK